MFLYTLMFSISDYHAGLRRHKSGVDMSCGQNKFVEKTCICWYDLISIAVKMHIFNIMVFVIGNTGKDLLKKILLNLKEIP